MIFVSAAKSSATALHACCRVSKGACHARHVASLVAWTTLATFAYDDVGSPQLEESIIFTALGCSRPPRMCRFALTKSPEDSL